MNAQILHSFLECSGQLELFVAESNHEIGAHGDPDLSLHRAGTRAVVMFDAEVVLGLAEEWFEAPSQIDMATFSMKPR